MNFAHLIDGRAAAVVLGGTALATLLRCGFVDCKVTLRVLSRLGRRRFNSDKIQAELAVQIREIQRDGLIRAHPHVFGDTEFEEAAGALIESRSVAALLDKHEIYKARRRAAATTASRTVAQAAELAPVFGLAGTLISLSQLSANSIAHGGYIPAISMAVLTTLYGLITANLLLAPLSLAIDRSIASEESERQKLFDWLTEQVASAVPRRRAPPLDRAA